MRQKLKIKCVIKPKKKFMLDDSQTFEIWGNREILLKFTCRDVTINNVLHARDIH